MLQERACGCCLATLSAALLLLLLLDPQQLRLLQVQLGLPHCAPHHQHQLCSDWRHPHPGLLLHLLAPQCHLPASRHSLYWERYDSCYEQGSCHHHLHHPMLE
jgi:hypothetical protein